MNEQNYLLGYLINESGEIYSSVYLDSAPDRHKENLRESHAGNDVYNQLWFMSAAEFQEALDNGIAIKPTHAKGSGMVITGMPHVQSFATNSPGRPGTYQSKAQKRTTNLVWAARSGTYRKTKK